MFQKLNWLMLQSEYPKESFPYDQSGVGFAICGWVNNGRWGDRFYWKSESAKASMKSDSRYSGALAHLTNEQSDRDRDYAPARYDLVYIKWDPDDSSSNVDHVGWIYKVENGRIYTWEGNGDGNRVVQKDYLSTDVQIAGYAHPQWFPFG